MLETNSNKNGEVEFDSIQFDSIEQFQLDIDLKRPFIECPGGIYMSDYYKDGN